MTLSPLPVAAAHHPIQLHKLRKRIRFSSNRSMTENHSDLPVAELPNTKSTYLGNHLEKEKDISRALTDALKRCRKIRENLSAKDMRVRTQDTQSQEPKLDLWELPDGDVRVNFNVSEHVVFIDNCLIAVDRHNRHRPCSHRSRLPQPMPETILIRGSALFVAS